jgi:hypothetical protein
MSRRTYSEEEQAQLRTNQHVASVTARRIVYAETFKRHALTAYQSGISPSEIFMHAGFNMRIIGIGQPKECLKRWRRISERVSHTEIDRLKWLEAEVKYLKAENAFLAQLRAKRAE